MELLHLYLLNKWTLADKTAELQCFCQRDKFRIDQKNWKSSLLAADRKRKKHKGANSGANWGKELKMTL